MRKSNKRTILWLAAGAAALIVAGQSSAAHVKHAKPAARATVPATQPVGPRYSVSLWWNHGSDGGALQSAMQKCGTRLGPAHATVFAPFPQTTVVTGSMLQCLEAEGWRPMFQPQPS